MTAMTIYSVPGDRYALVRGHGVGDWLRQHRLPGMYSARARGFSVRTERIGDLIAMAEADGHRVQLKDRATR